MNTIIPHYTPFTPHTETSTPYCAPYTPNITPWTPDNATCAPYTTYYPLKPWQSTWEGVTWLEGPEWWGWRRRGWRTLHQGSLGKEGDGSIDNSHRNGQVGVNRVKGRWLSYSEHSPPAHWPEQTPAGGGTARLAGHSLCCGSVWLDQT